MLEIRHLRSLRAIEELGSLSAAARTVSLTQSALSHQLRRLESYYEVALCLRNVRPAVLTEAGRKLCNLANDVLPHIDAVERSLKPDLSLRDRLHVVIECHSCFDWLLPALHRTCSHWPYLDTDTWMAFDALKLLARGDIDVVISSDVLAVEQLTWIELFRYEALLLVSPDHPFASKDRVLAKELITQTLVTYPVDISRLDVFNYFLQPAGLTIANRRTSGLTDMIVRHVESGRGVAVLPDWVIQTHTQAKHLPTCRLGNQGVHRTVYAVLNKADANSMEMKDFIAIALSEIERLAGTRK